MPQRLMESTQKVFLTLVLVIRDDVPPLVAAEKARQGALNALELSQEWDETAHSVKASSLTVDPSHELVGVTRDFGERLTGLMERVIPKPDPWEKGGEGPTT